MRIIVAIALLTIATLADAGAVTLLISRAAEPENSTPRGLGTGDFWPVSRELNSLEHVEQQFTMNLQDTAGVMAADAIWVNERWTDGRLSRLERQNLSDFIATGKRVVFVGENNNWRAWNDDFLTIFHTTTTERSIFWSGPREALIMHDLTRGVPALQYSEGGVPAEGGIPLFEGGVVSLFGPSNNVLVVLDSHVFSDHHREGHEQFGINTARWITAIPEPGISAMALLGSVVLLCRRCRPLGREPGPRGIAAG